jgi:hypothetical protein
MSSAACIFSEKVDAAKTQATIEDGKLEILLAKVRPATKVLLAA